MSLHYRIKRITFAGKKKPILLQSVEGPCPLLAICNILTLRGELEIHPEQQSITFEEIGILLREHLQAVQAREDKKRANDFPAKCNLALKSLAHLQDGLEVNVVFSSARKFSHSETEVFEVFGIRLFHAWVYDPQDNILADALADMSYTEACHFAMDELRDTADEDAKTKPAATDSKIESATDAQIARIEAGRELIGKFIIDNKSSQCTSSGLMEIVDCARENELFVLFRRNHFSTVIKNQHGLFSLITHESMLNRYPHFVWQRVGYLKDDEAYYGHDVTLPADRRLHNHESDSDSDTEDKHCVVL